ncbi:competence type IV pilus minor pilin ComGF [Bacillus tianshenii]|nr:competence type IV pilus minor pilin ComGF [Bacillus tianshenii]
MGKRNNEYGFTFIESMLSLYIFILIVSLLPLLFQTISFNKVSESLFVIESNIFFEQVEAEVRGTVSISKMANTLYLEQLNGDVALYELKGTNLRRRLNWLGHEVLMKNVKDIDYHFSGQQLELSVEGTNGQIRKHIIFLFRSDVYG